MPVRTQFDTGVYGGFQGGQASLADVIGAVRGVQEIAYNAKQMKREQELNDDEKFLDEVYAKNFTGWDGRDQADFQKRNQAAAVEVQRGRPKLFSKALGMSKTLEDAMMGRIEQGIDLDSKILDNEQKEINSMSSQMQFNRDFLKDMEYQQGVVGKEFALVANGKQTFQDAVRKIQALGVEANLPSEEEFNKNPLQFYDYLLAQKMQNDEKMSELDRKEKELGISKSEKELNWYDTLNAAKLNQLNRQGTGQGKPITQNIALNLSATKQGIDMLDNLVTKSDTFKSLTNSPLDKARALNPWDKEAQAFSQLIVATKQVIGKGLEGGVLRKEDEYKYEKILPKISDPLDVRKKKAEQLREMLVNKYNSDVDALGKTGADISNFPMEGNRYYTPPKAGSKKDGSGPTNDFDALWTEFGGK